MDGVAESMEIALVTRMLDSGGGSGGRIEYKPKDGVSQWLGKKTHCG
jgi:hypothetical protein